MSDKPLDQEQDLARGEENTAYMGFVSQGGLAGRVRKLLIEKFAEVLHRRNPMAVVWEDTPLFDDDARGDTTISDNTVYHLDFKSGNSGPRHDFTDDYTHFLFVIGSAREASVFLPAPLLLNSSTTSPVPLDALELASNSLNGNEISIAKESDTSFRVAGSASQKCLSQIIGYKMVIKPQSLV